MACKVYETFGQEYPKPSPRYDMLFNALETINEASGEKTVKYALIDAFPETFTVDSTGNIMINGSVKDKNHTANVINATISKYFGKGPLFNIEGEANGRLVADLNPVYFSDNLSSAREVFMPRIPVDLMNEQIHAGRARRFQAVETPDPKPAPKKDQIKGSSKNPKGSASGSKTVNFSKKVEESLSNKVKEHNEKSDRKASLRMLKAVYRRGAGAFSSSHRPDQNRNSWAMARVNAFLHLLKSGSPKNSKYTTDNDLLPASHPKSSKKSVRASGVPTHTPEDQTTDYEYDYSGELAIVLLPETEYTSKEQAIFALAEYSGVGYEIIPALGAAWTRGELANESPFDRAKELAISLHDSRDAELLPKEF